MGSKEQQSRRKVYISANAGAELIGWLEEQGLEVITISTDGIVSGPLSDHPDIFMCRLGSGIDAEIVFSQYIDGGCCGSSLGPVYPGDIAYNAACTGRFFIHNLKYTAPELLARAEELGMTMINTRQGYSKCSTVIVDEDSIITYDDAIAKPCMAAGMNVLKVRPGHVLLPGYDTGFIGGASGRIGDTIVFNGDLREHPDFDAIRDFIEKRGLELKWFPDRPLTDIGSMIIQ